MGVAVEFVWLGGVGLVGVVIFISKPTTVLRLCCVVVGVVTIYVLPVTNIKFPYPYIAFFVLI